MKTIKIKTLHDIKTTEVQTEMVMTIHEALLNNKDEQEIIVAKIILLDPPVEFQLNINQNNRNKVIDNLIDHLIKLEKYELINELQQIKN